MPCKMTLIVLRGRASRSEELSDKGKPCEAAPGGLSWQTPQAPV
jgi:hypothetical protein